MFSEYVSCVVSQGYFDHFGLACRKCILEVMVFDRNVFHVWAVCSFRIAYGYTACIALVNLCGWKQFKALCESYNTVVTVVCWYKCLCMFVYLGEEMLNGYDFMHVVA